MANWGRNREGEVAENAHFGLGCHLLSTGTGATTDCMALEQTHRNQEGGGLGKAAFSTWPEGTLKQLPGDFGNRYIITGKSCKELWKPAGLKRKWNSVLGIYFSGKLSHTISPKKSRPETEKAAETKPSSSNRRISPRLSAAPGSPPALSRLRFFWRGSSAPLFPTQYQPKVPATLTSQASRCVGSTSNLLPPGPGAPHPHPRPPGPDSSATQPRRSRPGLSILQSSGLRISSQISVSRPPHPLASPTPSGVSLSRLRCTFSHPSWCHNKGSAAPTVPTSSSPEQLQAGASRRGGRRAWEDGGSGPRAPSAGRAAAGRADGSTHRTASKQQPRTDSSRTR